MASGKQAFLITILIIGLISNVFAQSIIQIFPENLISDDRKALAGDDGLFCDSWRLSVETNNAGVWSTIPDRCISYVQHYMTGDKYRSDSEVVAGDSLAFAKTVEIAGDGLYAWVFDIDETLLSNLPYYTYHGFGESFNETAFDEWVDLAEAPALPASLSLYKALQQLGFKIVLLTGRGEYQRNATETNLLLAGFSDWEKLFLRGASDQGKPAIVYKSEKRSELMNEGYNIHGSSGDQWSDLLGFALAQRSFKLPNPMYYIG